MLQVAARITACASLPGSVCVGRAGRASAATSAPDTPAAFTGPACSRGSATVGRDGEDCTVTKVGSWVIQRLADVNAHLSVLGPKRSVSTTQREMLPLKHTRIKSAVNQPSKYHYIY